LRRFFFSSSGACNLFDLSDIVNDSGSVSESRPNERKHKLPECHEGKNAARAFETRMRQLITVPKSKLLKLEKQAKNGK
jgi:hypothetical protein